MTMPDVMIDPDDPPFVPPDMSHFITEDERPVDNIFSEIQQRLLGGLLHEAWPEGKPFIATSNVGLFYNSKDSYPIVPDFMLSLGVEQLPLSDATETKSYFIWVYGKAPDLVVEVVSNKKGGEDTSKMEIYANIRVTYYAIHDPSKKLSRRPLRLYRLEGGQYVEMANTTWMPEIGLGLTLWDGDFEGKRAHWLRFIRQDGSLIPTGAEMAIEAVAEAEAAQAATKEAQTRAERLAQRLRELGVDEEFDL